MIATLTDQLWHTAETDFPTEGDTEEQIRFLLRYAALAPSSHNSQPWEFSTSGSKARIRPVEERWLKNADPDKRELYLSIGCALANFVVAAGHFGIRTDWEVEETDGEIEVVVTCTPSDARNASEGAAEADAGTDYFQTLLQRRTFHKPFAPLPLDDNHKRRIRDAMADESIHLFFLEGATGPKKEFGSLTAKADKEQFGRQDYREELAQWLGAGFFGDGKLRAKIAQWVVKHRDIGDKQAQQDQDLISNAPAVAILATEDSSPEALVRCGLAFENIALAGISVGIGTQPMSAALETEALKGEVQELLPSKSMVAQHVFRLGYPTEQEDHTPRFPMEEVLK